MKKNGKMSDIRQLYARRYLKASARIALLMTAIQKINNFDFTQAGKGFTITNEPWMRLSINVLTPEFVSIAHTYVQQGDTMFDPEIVFFVDHKHNIWYPCDYRQDNLGINRSYVTFEGEKIKSVNTIWQKDLVSFCSVWSKNIREQGFLKALKKQVKNSTTKTGTPKTNEIVKTTEIAETIEPFSSVDIKP